LGPVADHHHYTSENEGDDEDEKGGFEIDKAHADTESVERHLTIGEAHVKLFALARKQVHERIPKSQEEKAGYISDESPEAVALIRQRAACIVVVIIFHMVHGHMMHKIGFRRVAEKRTYTPNYPMVKPGIGFA